MKNEQLKTSLARQLTKTIIIQRKNPDISLIEKEALSLVELYGQFSEEELKRYTIVTQYTYLTMPEYIGIKNRALLAWGTYYGMCFEVNHQLYKNRIKQQVKKTAKKIIKLY